MPWNRISPMEEINRFPAVAGFARSARFSVSDLCGPIGISRKTGCKHLERYAALLGQAGCSRAVAVPGTLKGQTTVTNRWLADSLKHGEHG
jgi:hypothetical protein